MASTRPFRAFVSYCHTDKAFAAWLQRTARELSAAAAAGRPGDADARPGAGTDRPGVPRPRRPVRGDRPVGGGAGGDRGVLGAGGGGLARRRPVAMGDARDRVCSASIIPGPRSWSRWPAASRARRCPRRCESTARAAARRLPQRRATASGSRSSRSLRGWPDSARCAGPARCAAAGEARDGGHAGGGDAGGSHGSAAGDGAAGPGRGGAAAIGSGRTPRRCRRARGVYAHGFTRPFERRRASGNNGWGQPARDGLLCRPGRVAGRQPRAPSARPPTPSARIRKRPAILAGARAKFTEAYRTTLAILARKPHNPETIFSHAQSEFWIGEMALRGNDRAAATRHWRAYRDQSRALARVEPEAVRSLMEQGYAEGNLCHLDYLDHRDLDGAARHCREAIRYEVAALAKAPGDRVILRDLANRYGWMGQVSIARKNFPDALASRLAELGLIDRLLALDPADADYALRRRWSDIAIGQILIESGKPPTRRRPAQAQLARFRAAPGNRGPRRVWSTGLRLRLFLARAKRLRPELQTIGPSGHRP